MAVMVFELTSCHLSNAALSITRHFYALRFISYVIEKTVDVIAAQLFRLYANIALRKVDCQSFGQYYLQLQYKFSNGLSSLYQRRRYEVKLEASAHVRFLFEQS